MSKGSKDGSPKGTPEIDAELKYTSGIEIDGTGFGDDGGLYLKISVGKRSTLLSVENLANNHSLELLRLIHLGVPLILNAAKQEFLKRVQKSVKEPPSLKVVTKPGLSNGVFVHPYAQFPKSACVVERYFDQKFAPYHEHFRFRGKFEDWKAIPDACRNKPRMVMGFALAFSGPVSAAFGYEPAGIQFVGTGGSGRTTVGQIIASIWGGDPDPACLLPFGASWNTTVNDLEYVATAHNHMTLWLDDMENAEKDGVRAVMKIMNGQGKGRMTQRRRQTYCTALMSTANKSVVAVLRDLGFRKGYEPYIDRLMDVPVPQGSAYFFDGIDTDAKFIAFGERLRELARANYGLAGPAFLRQLMAALATDRQELQNFCNDRIAHFRGEAEDIKSSIGRPLVRAKNRFATIYVAGCLAIRFGILPYTEPEMLDAAWTCLRDHVVFIEKELGTTDALLKLSSPAEAARKAYKAFQREVNRTWKNGLIDTRKPGRRVPQWYEPEADFGYIGVTNKTLEAWFSSARFQEMAGGAREARLLKQLLLRLGLLSTWASGNQSPKMVVRRPIPGHEDKWVVAVKLPPPYWTRPTA